MWIEGHAIFRETAGGPGRGVTVALDMRGLVIRGLSGETVVSWPFGRLVVDPRGAAFTLVCRGAEGRVEIADPPTRAAFEAAMKALPRQGDPRIPRAFSYTLLVILALIVVVLSVVWWGISALADRLAPMVPAEVVEMLDTAGREAVLGQIGATEAARCDTVAGGVALDALTARLAAAGGVRSVGWTVLVYRSDVPNALALPGGTLVVTDALLRRVRAPDAFAGVLAHEIGHVHHRHGLRRILHEGGIAAAVAMVTGDVSGVAGGAARLLIGAAYSRQAEREADAFAVAAVAAAGGDPRALGPFLVDLGSGAEDGVWSLLSTHPLSDDRRAAVEAAAGAVPVGQGPLLADADWSAIRAICG